jgi:hypothetical protein
MTGPRPSWLGFAAEQARRWSSELQRLDTEQATTGGWR